LGSIVERHGKVIAGRCFLARQDHIAPDRSIHNDGAGFARRSRAGLNPCQRTSTRRRGPHVQTQRIRFARLDTALLLGFRHISRLAWIKRRAIRVAWPRSLHLAHRHQPGNFGASFETRVN
jgi:hypothetical protein